MEVCHLWAFLSTTEIYVYFILSFTFIFIIVALLACERYQYIVDETKDDLRSTEVNGHQRRSAVECSNSCHHSLEILGVFDVNHLYAHWTGGETKTSQNSGDLGFGLTPCASALHRQRE
ncbi:hypothetical protein EVAR_91796_1 [Eumeta japonica]|uniref:Uncharacterized protein n=1 Tax=Eumeta variegata TaxID=151549 RepID=A0A4C1T8P8_EUMVA|nr:hypothetical protein EVAR_91796_1 [Eumeta japonica]